VRRRCCAAIAQPRTGKTHSTVISLRPAGRLRRRARNSGATKSVHSVCGTGPCSSDAGDSGRLTMVKAFGFVLLLLTVSACSSAPKGSYEVTPCTIDPGSYECQIENYKKAF
jgi:hypothetical protein